MAVVDMTKILIASHKSEADRLLSELQETGLIHLLSSKDSAVCRNYEQLACRAEKPRKLEEKISELQKDISFLEEFSETPTSLMQPKVPVSRKQYREAAENSELDEAAEKVNSARKQIDKLRAEDYELRLKYDDLIKWKEIDIPLNELEEFENVKFFIGTLPPRNFGTVEKQLEDYDVVLDVVCSDKKCVRFAAAADKSHASDVQKILRASEFEAFVHTDYRGTIAENLEYIEQKRSTISDRINAERRKAEDLADKNTDFQILHDYLRNKADAMYARSDAPGSDSVSFFEGWIKTNRLHCLDAMLEKFESTGYTKIEPEEGEQVPVAIENSKWARPFEAILGLYGSPQYNDVDPTAFMAPFFAVFFGLCLTDAAYGIVMILASIFFIKKFQGDKKFFKALAICSVCTVVAGAMTGGWFGTLIYDFAVKNDVGWLSGAIDSMTWFDPLVEPMTFLYLSLAMGYIQLMFGLGVGCWDYLRKGDVASAVINKLCWILLLNALIIMGGFSDALTPAMADALKWITIALLAVIGLFSVREGSWVVRIAGGLFELFGLIFYLGDLLSYLRLMALGMATAGVAMAVNIMAETTSQTPLIGWLATLLILVIGHTFNLLQSGLGAFVHTLRLQFVEYFPKFFSGGGMEFSPFSRNTRYVHIEEYKN
ncbi:V-type ATP synthase subunit I [Sedimentisphaera cyanobacteriorum]|uniref:V-type ATP synthase subunit I n=1 Tax=Sedimentisphaera cyanobacteriorum TaxID=1940790 RepID=A0A1Q2HMU1_9BACT|nr:V-type ATP synthase subunit I [Sedimentisphaera cyanobacteriorum]AQQ08680.1 V-type ATP synthase subunit I [Sedimentisphaera cyanobacteriorum]